MKRSLDRLFNDPTLRGFHYINDLLAILTLLSIGSLVLETVPQLDSYTPWFKAIEYSATAVFVIEYVLRLYSAKSARRYAFSFYGIIDLLSIIPTLLLMTNFLFLKSVRVLRILRLLRMLRLAKLMRIGHRHGNEVEDNKSVFRLNIQIYLVTLFSAVLLFGSLVYVFEAPRQGFESIPHGMLWSAETILGGGITGQFSTTVGGHIVSLLARFVGLVLLGALISIVGSGIKVVLLGQDIVPRKSKRPRRTSNHPRS